MLFHCKVFEQKKTIGFYLVRSHVIAVMVKSWIKISKILATIVLVIGILVTTGWIFDIKTLESVLPNLVTMKFSTSVSFIFSGIILYGICRTQEGKAGISEIVILMSGMVIFLLIATLLVSNLIGVYTGIENSFVKEVYSEKTPQLGRPSVVTMIDFIMIVFSGIASLLNYKKLKKAVFWTGLTILSSGGISLIGYMTNLPFLYYHIQGWSTAMAIHTSILFILLGVGLIILKSNYGLENKITKSIKLKTKLVSLLLIVSIIPIIFVGSLSYSLYKSFNSTDSLENGILLIGFITMIAVVIFALTASRLISEPIMKLKNVADRLSEDNFDVMADEYSSNEIGELGKSFNHMVTNIKASREKLALSERLSAIGELSSRIAHDLRNPLAALLSNIGIMEHQINNKNPDFDVSGNFERMRRAINRMNLQINGILDHIRVDQLDLKPVSVTMILKYALEKISVPPNVTINLSTNDSTVVCDSVKIEVVFENLIMNAIQAGKNIELDIRILEDSRNVSIEFEDSGLGISDDDLPRLFDPLFTTKQQDTGLGLVTCKKIVELHGGSITVKTKPTVFTVLLPKNY